MKKLVVFIAIAMCMECGMRNNSTGMTREEYLNTLDSTELLDGLVFWASDTAFTTNADLLLLLEKLYRHVRTDSFPSDVKKEEKWMTDYRSRLISYYNDHSLGTDTISPFAKADSVLNEGVRLMELGCQWSTMEMVVNNSTIYTFDRCREYSMLTQLINSSETNEVKELVYKEWALYEKIRRKMELVASNMVYLDYWGGSITGSLSTAICLQISKTRREMYQTLLDMVNDKGWDNTGVYPENAERFFLDCCNTSIKRKGANEYNRQDKGFIETVRETKSAIVELRPLVREWIVILDKLDDSLTYDANRHSVERAASYMLMKWSSFVTE